MSPAHQTESRQNLPEQPAASPDPPVRRTLAFILLTIALSIPFWIFGERSLPIPVRLPVSAFAAFNPMLAALILVLLDEGPRGVIELFSRVLNYRKIQNRAWYLAILLLSPLVYVLSYAVMRLAGMPLPDPEIPLLMAPFFLAVFILFGIGEELGWTGYAIDPLQNRYGALAAAAMLGVLWGLFHLIPDLQNGQAADWILWQRLGSMFQRILIVWIYNNTGKSVFSAVLFHAVNNLCWALFPNYGSHFNPMVTGLILMAVTGLVVTGWGSRTLSHFRLSRQTS